MIGGDLNQRIQTHTEELKEFEEESARLATQCESLNGHIEEQELKLQYGEYGAVVSSESMQHHAGTLKSLLEKI